MRSLSELGEFGLIGRLARLIPPSANVLEGIGDDCAILRVHEHFLLVSTDLFVENVHFRRNLPPEQIGWRAAAASLSDIAAMGGVPYFSLISMGCPADLDVDFLEDLYRGINNLFSRFNTVIVGGDTTRSPNGLVLDVMVMGEAVSGRYRLRSGALPGDLLGVTGPLGLAAGGLHALERGAAAPALIQAYAQPRPRIPEGQSLCANASVHAMIDVSDGLAQDAGHIARASDLGLDLHAAEVAIRPELRAYAEAAGLDPLELALYGGDDYEIAFAIAPDNVDRFIDDFQNQFNSEVAIIGEFTEKWKGVRLDGCELQQQAGYDHFKRDANKENI